METLGCFFSFLVSTRVKVKERDLASGKCWARCDVSRSWEVRWEGSANVDDGTAQVHTKHSLSHLQRRKNVR